MLISMFQVGLRAIAFYGSLGMVLMALACSDSKKNTEFLTNSISDPSSDVCTMEVKVCGDGSSVGREADKHCEFKKCPDEK